MTKFSVLALIVLVVLFEYSSFADAQQQCGLNAEWNDCGTACPDNCQNFQILRPCTRQCVFACRCLPGFVFQSGSSGNCIRSDQC